MPLRDGDPSRIGRFRLSARLGAGGMGVVYLGTAKVGTQAAVKVLRPELADDPEFLVRFRREVAVLARVDGLCTARMLDADTEATTPFLATEYIDGPSLAEYVGQHGPLGPDMLQGLAVGLAEALTAIHAAGVIHRDLKPANVLLTEFGPKVIDFGIAQALGATSLTQAGMAVGSPGFMAPEQIAGQVGQSADIFVWGLTVAFAATGQSPFGGGPTDAVLYRILHESPDMSGVPGQLRDVVERALIKDPANRPAARELVALAASPIVTSDEDPAVKTRTVLARTWHPPTTGGLRATPPPRRPRRWLLALAAATLVATAVGATAGLLTDQPHQGTPSASGVGRTAAAHSASAPAPTDVASAASTVSRAAAPPTTSDEIHPGTHECGFSTANGGYQLYAVAGFVAACSQVSGVLASFGTYWYPLSASTLSQDEQRGDEFVDAASDCHLTAPGGAVLSIYADPQPALSPQAAPTAPDPLAEKICITEEANGWTPHASTQS